MSATAQHWTALHSKVTPTVGHCAQPVPLPSFFFIPTALSQTGGAVLLAYHRALCPIPSLARSHAVAYFVPILRHLGRPPRGWVRLHPRPVLLNPSAGVCSLPDLCAVPSLEDTAIPSVGTLPAICGTSYIFSSITYPVHQENSLGVLMGLMGLWAIIGEMMENACRAGMLYLPRQVLICRWQCWGQHLDVGTRSWSQTRLHVVPEMPVHQRT